MNYAVLMDRVFQENPTYFLLFENTIWNMLNDPKYSTVEIGMIIVRELRNTDITTPNILSTIFETKGKIEAGFNIERTMRSLDDYVMG